MNQHQGMLKNNRQQHPKEVADRQLKVGRWCLLLVVAAICACIFLCSHYHTNVDVLYGSSGYIIIQK